jgi:beta-glucosidase
VVVLHTSGPVLMPWRRRVAGIVEAWYPGQQSGRAVAKTLFGDVDPSGRLPVTWPASSRQGPTATPAAYPGVDDTVHYAEGLRVGYRWYDSQHQKPLFPFGYGGSYTRFRLGALTVAKRGTDHFVARVPVRNVGARTGAEVVQLYVGDPKGSGEPPRQLKGFAKVRLRPGRTGLARMRLGPSSFATWSTAKHRWVVAPGRYRLAIGTSSRRLPRRAAVTIRPRSSGRARLGGSG